MIGDMTIGQLARCTGLPVRTLRFDADEGVLPEADRTESGYRLFGPEAVARGRLVRTLRELGVGLADIKRVRAPGRLRGSSRQSGSRGIRCHGVSAGMPVAAGISRP
jgi:hypothetical protein